MQTIKLNYTINMLSDWHVGSGLDAGTNVNALVAKTEEGLPFIPGKTIKGLLRDAFEDMADVDQVDKDIIISLFGSKSETNSNVTQSGKAFFSNAYLLPQESQELINNQLHSFLYRNIASTKINQQGTAATGSLRSIQVCVPLQLEGNITLEDAAHTNDLKRAAKLVRHLGIQRNRGLGRCQFSITEKPKT